MEAAQRRWKNKSRNGQTWHYRCCKRNPAQVNNDARTVDFVVIELLISHVFVTSTSVINQQRNSVLNADQKLPIDISVSYVETEIATSAAVC